MKSNKIISMRNEGIYQGIAHNKFEQEFQWKVDIIYIKSNSDGGFPAGFNSTEARIIR